MTTAAELDARYGRGRPRRSLWVVLGILASGALALGIWWTVAANLTAVDADDLGYEVIDEHAVQLRFQVTAPRDREVVCVLEAQDESKGIVGWRLVRLPASPEHTRAFSERIPTVALATTGLVNTCWVS